MNQKDATPLQVFGDSPEMLMLHFAGLDVTLWRPATLDDWVESGLLDRLAELDAPSSETPIMFFTRGVVTEFVEDDHGLYAVFENTHPEESVPEGISVPLISGFRYRITPETLVSY